MTEENQAVGGVNFSDINSSEIHIGDISIAQTAGGDIIGRDKLTIGQQIINLFTGTSDQQRDLRNRQVMLTAVRKFWVEGVLEQSLHGAALIELGVEEKKEAVTYPWDMVLQRPNQQNWTLPAGTKMIDVFDQAGRSLLILGEPGSGKTTMLLELARQTIERAEKDLSQPIPVVFNLSSWAEKRSELGEWLVEELNTKYSIPKKVAKGWIENDALLLLLDGLDEVAQQHRVACVEAINAIYKDSMMSFVVCSRVADYEGLPVKLGLEQAVVLQSLTKDQIKVYLNQFEADLAALKMVLERDRNLQELAESPLMLSIMALAYRGLTVDNLPHLDSIEAQRRRLFEVYVRQVLERKGVYQLYPADKTRQWLSWLAARMVDHSQTVFLIERLQPRWLLLKQKRTYLVGNILSIGLIFGLMTGLIFGLLGGLVGGLLGGLIFGLSNYIRPAEVLRWSWQKFRSGLFFGLSVGSSVGLLVGLSGGLLSGLSEGLSGGLVFGLFFGLSSGLSGEKANIILRPNQGIWASLKNGLMSGLIFGLSVGLIGVLRSGLIFGLLFGLLGGLLGGLLIGLSFEWRRGASSGIDAFIQHFCLRFICYRSGHMPWNYVRFLDYAAERILLRKVGGGYVFIHRYLMEYFASLEPEK